MRRRANRQVFLACAGAALIFALAACGGSTSSAASHESSATGGGPAGLTPASLDFERAVDVRHIGVRLVTTNDTTMGVEEGTVQFLERVLSDGEGSFALEPIGPAQLNQPPAANWGLFSIFQFLRQGLHVRYRDFEVRDAAAFQREWSLRELGTTVTVAARPCRRVDVTHTRSGRTYELSIDDETHLVLDQRELDAQGQLLFQVTYQSLDLAPSFLNVVWYDTTPAVSYALDADLEGELGFDVRIPTNPPAGYTLHDIESLDTTVKGDDQGPWLKITFTNGMDPLFYVVSIPSGLAASRRPGNPSDISDFAGGYFRALSIGRASAGIAELRHGTVMAAGRVSVDELADLIHSAIPQ